MRRRRSRTGRPAVAEDGRVRRQLPEPAFEVPGSGRAWLGGPTDARENLKKLRRQLGLRITNGSSCVSGGYSKMHERRGIIPSLEPGFGGWFLTN